MGFDLTEFGFDKALKEIYLKLMREYSGKMNISLVSRIKVAIAINDKDNESRRIQLESIKEDFNLSDNELNGYVTILTIDRLYTNMYRELKTILELVADDEDLIKQFAADIDEIKSNIKELKDLISKFTDSIGEKEGHRFSFNGSNEESVPSELATNCNFLLFLSNVDEFRKKTIESRAGIGQISMKKICSHMTVLSCYSYGSLISNGESHNINDNGNNIKFTNYDSQFRRISSGTTKLCYIKISVNSNNLEMLKAKYKNFNLEYLMLVVCFGDFINEGRSEKKMYSEFISVARKMEGEMEKIIRIFNEPFTPETFAVACSMIEHGNDILRSLREDPSKSIAPLGKGK